MEGTITISKPWELLVVIEYPPSHYNFGGALKQELSGAAMCVLLDVEAIWERTMIHQASKWVGTLTKNHTPSPSTDFLS